MRWQAWVALACLLIGWGGSAGGQTTLRATCGWGDAVRRGRWEPILVTIAGPDLRGQDVLLRIEGKSGIGAADTVLQHVVAQPKPTTYALLYPLNCDLSQVEVTAIDGATGRTLATAGLPDITMVATDQIHIGISGDISDAMQLKAQLETAGVSAGIMRMTELPYAAIGYEGIDLLILASPDWESLDGVQERAIVDWIEAGGQLLVLPGAEPVPGNADLLISHLPCKLGETRLYGNLNGRELTGAAGATASSMEGLPAGYTGRDGLGQIRVLPAGISPVPHSTDDWRELLRGMVAIPFPKVVTSVPISPEQEDIAPSGPGVAELVGRGPRESAAMREILDLMNASHGGEAGWRGALWLLMGLGFFAGPVDTILLMRLGKSPRHWATVMGTAGFLAAMAAMHFGAKPAARISDFRLIDEADGHVIVRTDVRAAASTKNQTIELSPDPREWWEPANQAATEKARTDMNRFLDLTFHEDRDGCRPQGVQINANDAVSFRGQMVGSAPALVAARLRLVGSDRLVGTVKNLGSVPMRDVQIATSAGTCRLGEDIGTGAEVSVDVPLARVPIELTGLPADVQDTAIDQTDRIRQCISAGYVCVYGQVPDGDHPWQVVRAVFALHQ